MRLDQGLFKLDFNDHYAVLGLPMDADGKVVRKRYLQIARKLHPDSMSGASEDVVRKASDTLSKLVNPAYETLSQEKSSNEYQIVLKMRGQTLQRSNTPPEVETSSAQNLLKSPQFESDYRQAVTSLSKGQYEQLETLEAIIGQLSELNLVYLYRASGGGASVASPATRATPATPTPDNTQAQAKAVEPPPRGVRSSIVESYINRAQGFERSKDPGRAILELREALKTYPNSADCHSYLASLYLKAGQTTMAKIHAKRALDINPNDQQAKAVQARVEKGSSSKASEAAKGGKGKTDGKGGGLFGLFGGKKK